MPRAAMSHHGCMEGDPGVRSVKIPEDERGGWSSDRPRRTSGPPRPADLTVRCRVLRPSDRMRYSPGSLLVVVSASAPEREQFVERVIEDRDKGAVLSPAKVRGLIAGRVPEDQIAAQADKVLEAALLKRLEAGETVVIAADGLEAAERERYVRPAAALRRPRHLILIEVGKDRVAGEDRSALNELRRALDAGELGEEGFQTAMRVGGASVSELKRIVFRPPPRED